MQGERRAQVRAHHAEASCSSLAHLWAQTPRQHFKRHLLQHPWQNALAWKRRFHQETDAISDHGQIRRVTQHETQRLRAVHHRRYRIH